MRIGINRKSVLSYILLLLCLLNCNSIYSTSRTIDYRFPELTAAVLAFLVVIGYTKLKASVVKRWLSYFIIYEVAIILLLINSVSSEKYISFLVRFAAFIPLFALCVVAEEKNGNPWYYLIKYRNLVCLYAFISIVMWLLVCQLNILPQTGVCQSSWGIDYNYPTYFGIFTYRQTQMFLGIKWIRNQGFFAEAPMYNLVLLIAVAIELFINPLCEKANKSHILGGVNLKRLIILVVADITTFTTTGMILLIAMGALKYCLLKKKTSLGLIIKWIVGIGVVTAALFIMNTLFLEKSTDGSWIVRSDDILAGIKTWLQSPVFGMGYDLMEAIEKNYSSFRVYNMGYSSGFFSVLAQGGILLMAIYIIGLIGFMMYGIRKKSYELFAFLMVIVIIWVMTIFQNSFLMMILLAHGYAFLICSVSKSNVRTRKQRVEYEKIA